MLQLRLFLGPLISVHLVDLWKQLIQSISKQAKFVNNQLIISDFLINQNNSKTCLILALTSKQLICLFLHLYINLHIQGQHVPADNPICKQSAVQLTLIETNGTGGLADHDLRVARP